MTLQTYQVKVDMQLPATSPQDAFKRLAEHFTNLAAGGSSWLAHSGQISVAEVPTPPAPEDY